MTLLLRTIDRAHRRAAANRMLLGGGRGLAAGLALALVAIVAARASGLDARDGVPYPVQSQLWASMIPPLAGFLAGAGWTMFRGPGRLNIAVLLDRSLGLKDRVGTAESIRQGRLRAASGLSELAVADAERLAGRIDVASATPIRMTRAWGLALVLALAVAGAVAFMPTSTRGNEETSPASPQVSAEGAAGASPAQDGTVMADTLRDVSQRVEPEALAEGHVAEQLAALDRLAEQLKQPLSTPEELRSLRDESAAALSTLADRVEQSGERRQLGADELARRFQALNSHEAPLSQRQLAEALKRGDFGQAADLLEEALAGAGSDPQRPDETPATDEAALRAPAEPPAEPAKSSGPESKPTSLSDDLRKLSEQLAAAAKADPAARENRSAQDDAQRERLRQAMRDQGVDEETIEQLLNPPQQERQAPEEARPEQSLEEKSVDPDIAKRLARDLQQFREWQQAQESADREATELADALRETADRLDQPQKGTEEPSPPQPSPPSPAAREPSQREASQPSRAERQPEKSADGQSPPEPTSGSEQRAREREGASSREVPSDATSPGRERAAEQRGGDSKPDAREQAPGQSRETSAPTEPKADGAQPTPEPGASSAQQEQQTSDASAPQGSERQAEERQAEQGADGERQAPGETQPAAKGDARRPSVVERLRKWAGRGRAAEQSRNASEELREAARKLAGTLSDSERQEMQRWLPREQNQPGSPPGSQQQRDMTSESRAGASDGGHAGEGRTRKGQLTPPDAPAAWRSENVDARGPRLGPTEDDQIIANWLSDEPLDPAGHSGPGAAPSRIQQARRAAERAVNESAVPTRYHELIQRYFGRLGTTPPAPPAPSAPAAQPSGTP